MWNCPTEGAVLSMQLSLFYKLESLLCCIQFLNWRLCPLGSEHPCYGLGPWAGLERAEGNGLCAPGLVSVPPLQQTERWTALRASDPAGHCPEQATQADQGSSIRLSVSMTLLGQSPLQLVERRASVMPPMVSKTTSSVPPWPALPIPMRSQPLPLLAPPLGEEWHQGSGSQYLQAA